MEQKWTKGKALWLFQFIRPKIYFEVFLGENVSFLNFNI